MQWGNLHLWTMILTSSLAALMPNPKFRVLAENSKLDDSDMKEKAFRVLTENTKLEDNGIKETTFPPVAPSTQSKL